MSSPTVNPLSLDGKRALVTGASSGIGRAVAVLLSQLGAEVAITGRNAERLSLTAGMLAGQGHSMIVADLADEAGRKAIAQGCGKLDAIAHCAGIASSVVCKSLEQADLQRVFDANVFGPALLQKELLQAKQVGKGASIVFVASMAYERPCAGNAAYSASKGALISYAKVLALELAPRKIRVNCISPGMVRTPLVNDMLLSDDDMRRDQANYMLGRYGEPADVANLAAFLLSDASSWMTAGNIEINGGMM